RGGLPGEERFDAEVATAAKCGATVVSVPMTARELPPPATLRRLVRVIDQAPRPLLIHCAGGADRSGFASALYRILQDGASVDKAQDEELSWHYGHFSFGMAQAMDQFFDLYRSTSSGKPMRRWISDEYPRIYLELVEGGVVHAIRSR
ncbi:MAG: tyrosine-protein phosphatase, partial [Armatimonadota bacterium]|nr:tyrosine-protein phosphatase [Armatimonadota bacterium]